jgi:hypothetical protein
MKTVLHIFQQEDPDSLGQWKIHPTDPRNFIDTATHLALFSSWFNDSGGANDFLSKLCDDPTDASPHMEDARFRFLNTGTVGVDIFFHPDNRGWGIGAANCPNDSINSGEGGNFTYRSDAIKNYITSPSSSNPDYSALIAPETQNAFHVFITGGTWVPEGTGDPSVPDEDDCYYLCGGGFTGSANCAVSSLQYPSTFIHGAYQIWLSGNDMGGTNGAGGDCSSDYETSGGTDAAMGRGLIGEIMHVLSLDHISPLQAHRTHPHFYDSCEDTPPNSIYNLMGCDFANRCAFSQCQLGRIQQFFAENQPVFERFPDGQGGFTSIMPCESTEEDIVIPDGANITWAGPRTLRSGVTIESGGTLTVKYDLGMPTDARFTVEGGGKLIIDGAHIYSNCGDSLTWAGISVQGTNNIQFPLSSNGQGLLRILPGSVIEAADTITIDQGALIWAQNSDFVNCGLILFSDYHKHSWSRMTGCNFERKAESWLYFEANNWPDQIGIFNLNRLLISGCTFETVTDAQSYFNNGTAINSFESKFEVIGCTISDYKTGISGASWFDNGTGGFSIKQCTLSNNQESMIISSSSNPIINDNVITGIGDFNASSSHIGLLLEESTGFEVTGK